VRAKLASRFLAIAEICQPARSAEQIFCEHFEAESAAPTGIWATTYGWWPVVLQQSARRRDFLREKTGPIVDSSGMLAASRAEDERS